MEVIVGKTAGFCYGVKRAVESAENDIINSKEKIYCLGEIVHNKQVIDDLKEKGINFIEDINEADSTAIIRAHGVPKDVYKVAEENKIKLKDYTCPNVLKIHKLAEDYANKGYYILLFGSKNHPENIGTMSFCGDKYFVIENEDELFNAIKILNKGNIKKVLVISQTTFKLDDFYTFVEILKDELYKDIELVIENTICRATEVRQLETEELSKKVDCMIIIGGKNSSNTKKLYEIAKENCEFTICVETKKELENMPIVFGRKVGIMAGASTPQKSIDEICEMLKSDECACRF